MKNKKIAIFSGSSEGTGEYVELTKTLGQKLAENSFTIVNGGGPGLMEVVAKSAHENGGEVVGIHFEFEGRVQSKYNTETISFTELYPRQQKIISMADAFVVLPGGIGTIFELIEVVAKKHLQEINEKIPIILVSREFWNSVLQMMRMQIDKGFIKKEMLENLKIVDSAEEVLLELKHELREINNETYGNGAQ